MPRLHRISVLMTTHNRREQTLGCLDSLFGQGGIGEDFVLQVALVDADSTDGTREAVAAKFPSVRVERAQDSVYWGHGMRIAANLLSQIPCDYHLWLNDDVLLDPAAIRLLLRRAGRS